MTRSTSSGAGFTNGNSESNNGHVPTAAPLADNSENSGGSNLGLVKARTMSYTQKLMENGDTENSTDRKFSSGQKPNIKELTNKQRNWFSSFEKSKVSTESIDSARRTSVKSENTPSIISGGGGDLTPPPSKSLPPDATPTPPSSLNLPRDRRPLSARGSSDSIEDYLRNWKKNENGTSPIPSPGIESVK